MFSPPILDYFNRLCIYSYVRSWLSAIRKKRTKNEKTNRKRQAGYLPR